jgi:tetratricopeptide (TPR) repeat protein
MGDLDLGTTIVVVAFIAVAVVFAVFWISRFVKSRAGIRRSALACIGDEVSIYTDKGALLAYKGIYAYLCGDYSKALQILEKALKYSHVSHNSSFCFDWISQCYEAQEKSGESLTYCVKAVEAEPSNIKSLFNLAEMYAREGSFEKSEFYYSRILRYEAKNSTAAFMLGMLFMGRGEYEQAEEWFLKTLELDPEFAAANAELSVIMAIKGDYSKMDGYLSDSQKPISRRHRGIIEIDSDRLKKRLDSIKRIQELVTE